MKLIKQYKGLSNGLALATLVLTVSGPFSRAYGAVQQPATGEPQTSANQKSNDRAAARPALMAYAAGTPTTAAIVAPTPTAPPPPSGSSEYNWTGFYVGAHVGYGAGNGDAALSPLPSAATFVNLLPQTLHPDPSGILGGGQFGANWQHGELVLGAETDFSASGMNGTKTITPIVQNNGTPFPGAGFVAAHQDISWLGTLRGRAGVTLIPRLLIYGTGGLAYGHVTSSATTNFRPVGTTIYLAFLDGSKVGWTAGAGGELGLSRRWSMKLEYLHYDFGAQSQTVNAVPLLPPFQVFYLIQNRINAFNGGVNFRF